MWRKGLRWALAALAVVACSDANPSEPEGVSLEAGAYLSRALDVMEFNSIEKDQIDWPSFRAMAFEDADNARSPADTYDAIRAALVRIGDNHSFFQPPSVDAPTATGEQLAAT